MAARQEPVRQGRALQVDPMKPKLKPRGTKLLKLKCDILLQNSAFKFNVRRYIKVLRKKPKKGAKNQKPITKTEPCESFFNFFSPPEVPEDDDDLTQEDAEALQVRSIPDLHPVPRYLAFALTSHQHSLWAKRSQ